MNFIGKFAVVGMGGAGKTRAVIEIANFLAGQDKYSWKEEENVAGTLTVTPYSMEVSGKKKIILADNPGQNSLELVRLSVAKSGGDYKGILIFADALGWNFKNVGITHAESIAKYLNSADLPVAFITAKADMIIRFQQTGILKDIALVISDAVTLTFDKMIVPYKNRVKNIDTFFELRISDGEWILFTQLEQVIVNELDKKFSDNIEGFTYMNRRLFVRSLLLGFCEYYRKEFPEYIAQYPVFNAIDDNLLNSLNYHRPSAMETDTPWKVLAAMSRSGVTTKFEIPFRQVAFTAESIEYVLNNFCLGTQSRHYQLEGEMRKRAEINGWKFVASAYTDSISKPGIERSLRCLIKLVDESSKLYGKSKKKRL